LSHATPPPEVRPDGPERPEGEIGPVRRATPRKRRADERGVALILVLGAITVLTVFLTQLQEETSSELAAALSERDALKAEYFARSAVNLSRLLIATEPEISKAIGPIMMLLNPKGGTPQIPVWEFTDLVLGPFNDASGAQSFLATIGGDATTGKNLGIAGGGRFELSIVDEDAKINLNLAAQDDHGTSADRLASQLLGVMAPPTFDDMFLERDPDGQFTDRQGVCSALVDWADSEGDGNETQYPCQPHNSNFVQRGAEDNFYQTINMAYQRKNAAFDSLQEVRLVRGITDDFWTNFVDPEPDNPKKRIMTVWGQGGINVNAANAQTLLAFVCGQDFATPPELCTDPTQMQTFIMGVTLGKGMTFGMPLFGKPQDFINMLKGQGPLGQVLAGLQLKPVTFKSEKTVQSGLTIKSHRFSIYADGIVPGYKRTTKVRIHAVVDYKYAGQMGAGGTVIVGGGQAAAAAIQLAQATPATGAPGTPGTPAGAPGTTSGGTAASAGSGSTGTPDDILKQLNSNPAGTIIYWRVE
jgi:general secretion pathway protein K